MYSESKSGRWRRPIARMNIFEGGKGSTVEIPQSQTRGCQLSETLHSGVEDLASLASLDRCFHFPRVILSSLMGSRNVNQSLPRLEEVYREFYPE